MPTQPTAQIVAQISKSLTVTPSDTDTIAATASVNYGPTRGLLVGAAGIVKVKYPDGTTDSPYLAAGTWHPMNVTQVYSTGTDSAVKTGGIFAGW